MNTGWPPEIQRTADGSGVTYQLPVRPLGFWRWIGLLPVGFGVLFIRHPLTAFVRFIADRFAERPVEFGDVFGLLFMIPFLAGGLIPIALGSFLLFGRCRIECRNRRLRITEHAGPFRWRRTIDCERLKSLEVAFGNSKPASSPEPGSRRSDFCGLSAYTDAPKPRLVVLGYPRSWLHAVARELSGLLNPLSGVNRGSAIEVRETVLPATLGSAIPSPQQDTEHLPPGSRIQLDHTPAGLCITVPPPGLRQGSYGLIFIASIWCGMVLLITVMSLARQPRMVLVPFWIIGLGLLAIAVHLGRRRTLIRVEAECIHVTRSSPLRTSHASLPAAELRDICVGPSGIEVNHVPLLELQLLPRTGRKLGFLAGRNEQELHWIATQLRRATGLSAPPGG